MKRLSYSILLVLLVVSFVVPAAAQVNGTFLGNGKNAKLTYLNARPDKVSTGEEIVLLTFTEKDPGNDKKPDDKAAFGDYGNALVVRILKSGEIYGSEVRHSALSVQSFTSIGTLQVEGFKWDAAGVSGKLSTKGSAKFFKDTWEVNLDFKAPLS
jgi:hypothetical protein